MRLFFTGILFFVLNTGFGQRYISKTSTTTFFSEATLEDIKATNDNGRSVFDSSKKEIVFTIPIKDFQFRKSLMREHFNEKYMESDKFPKSTFTGKVSGFIQGSPSNEVIAEGTLEIHGVKKTIKVPGKLNFIGDQVHLECKFMVKLEDYDIEIPTLLFQNIAEEVEVTLIYDYELLEN